MWVDNQIMPGQGGHPKAVLLKQGSTGKFRHRWDLMGLCHCAVETRPGGPSGRESRQEVIIIKRATKSGLHQKVVRFWKNLEKLT